MRASCDIVIDFDGVEKVKTILKSIEVDDLNYVKSDADGKRLKAHIEGESISSLLHTLDDYLACVSVAEKIVDKN
jgi:hypothetical protein